MRSAKVDAFAASSPNGKDSLENFTRLDDERIEIAFGNILTAPTKADYLEKRNRRWRKFD